MPNAPLKHNPRPARTPQVDQQRPNAAARGYDARWRKARESFLADHPLCTLCECNGITEAATVVDHAVPHRGNKKLFWDITNWIALCKRCHDRKTARGQ